MEEISKSLPQSALLSRLPKRLGSRRESRRFVGRGFPRSIEGIEVIAGIFANREALSSFVARRKSSAGCFFGI